MKKVLVLVSSVREGRASAALASTVIDEIKDRKEMVGEIVDLQKLQLPFYDAELLPSAEGFVSEHENVRQWQQLVKESDGLVMLTPEYNAGLAATQKNAIDWLHPEWKDKPIAVVGYSWHGAPTSRVHLSDVLKRVDAREVQPATALSFKIQIETDGTTLDVADVSAQLSATLDALEAAIGK